MRRLAAIFLLAALPAQALEAIRVTPSAYFIRGEAGVPSAANRGHTSNAGFVVTSEALRLIAQRGIRVDGEVVADKGLVVAAGRTVVVQAGKRKFARVTVT